MIKKNANASGGKAKRSLDILRECILVNDISAMARTIFRRTWVYLQERRIYILILM
jgi:hypothetical protein